MHLVTNLKRRRRPRATPNPRCQTETCVETSPAKVHHGVALPQMINTLTARGKIESILAKSIASILDRSATRASTRTRQASSAKAEKAIMMKMATSESEIEGNVDFQYLNNQALKLRAVEDFKKSV